MKNIYLTLLVMVLIALSANSQQLTQTVRGTITDADNNLPLIGASVVIIGSEPLTGTTTDATGYFRLEKVSIGRISLQVSYLGYENKVIPNIEVTSGKEVVMIITMQESMIKMEEVVVKGSRKGEAINEMSLLSARSVSTEETNRYANSWSDPSRVVSNFAGVASNPDGASFDIIVRGNSPKYMQWRLDGIEIPGPYHFDDQNSSNGGLSVLNNKLLATSDFYTGAFSSEYGNVLSNVMDVKLREGNNEKFEAAAGLGLLGTEITLEGPLKKGYTGSFLVNYRYSTSSLLSQLGMIDLGDLPDAKFQDFNCKLVFPTTKAGTFSFFGIGGLSGLDSENIKMGMLTTPGSSNRNADIRKDYDKNNYLCSFGLNHTYTINNKSFIKSSLSYSGSKISDDIQEYTLIKEYGINNELLKDSVSPKIGTFNSELLKSSYRIAITYNNKINANNKLQVGTKYSILNYIYDQSIYDYQLSEIFNVIDFEKNTGIINNFVNWKHTCHRNVTLVAGLHNMNVLLNNKSIIEPRIAFNFKLNNTNSLHVGYGKHSTMENIQNYYVKIKQEDGIISEPNKNLDLLKAHHFVMGYEKRFTDNLMAKVELYYQKLYDLPVENNKSSYYATINEGIEYNYVALVNKGVGKNYGLEITLERFFENSYYFLVNGSLFESKYKSLEGVWRNTQYNGNYIINVLGGKEFKNIGKNKNKTLAINAKVFLSGGKKYIPLLRDANGNLAIDPIKNKYWDYEKAFENKIDDIYSVNLSLSYKINKAKATHEIFLDLQNITNNQSRLSEYYDESKPNKIGYSKQMYAFPNLGSTGYRVSI